MKNWIETYPHKVYASVLLLNGEIVDYKVGEHYWTSVKEVTLRGQISYKDLLKCTVNHKCWEVNSKEEHENVFNKLSVEWINNQTNKGD